ncbi:MAG TPA: arginine--tRNA ligase, partial [Chitinophagaceae bacterium]|nr:arginine--tRNA ligase [Chitinophagaceae bacterium]
IYVIADEQNYHMKVLSLVLGRLGKPYASGLFHLSYGMVDLTTGKMKSREGTVVDADDLIRDMIETSAAHGEAQGKVKGFSENELLELHQTIGIGAMKFFLLRVNPKKRMVFDPEESIDLNGFTAPFIQYAHARIRSILRKEQDAFALMVGDPGDGPLLPLEKELILVLERYSTMVEEAARELDPSVLAVYLYGLAKSFNSLYAELPISRAETSRKKILRLQIALATSIVLSRGMGLLGIGVPERM